MQEQQTRTSAQILADLHAALGYQGTKDAIARRVIEHPTELRMQAARQIWLGLQKEEAEKHRLFVPAKFWDDHTDRFHGDEPMIVADFVSQVCHDLDLRADEPAPAGDPSLPTFDLAMIEQAESELSRISYAIRSGCGITDEQAQEFTVGMCCDFNETLLRALHFYRANLRRQS